MVVIDLVSASKLKNDFIKYEKDELEKLSDSELSKYRDSLVIELMKVFKNGAISDNPDGDEINDLIDSYMEIANKKYINADTVLLDRKFRYLVNAYFTANIYSINRVSDLILIEFSSLVTTLINCKIELRQLLMIYHNNYSNHGMLNDLFFKLSTADDLDVTFEIHEKYLNNEFGVNKALMIDLDYMIESTVERMFYLIDKVEKLVDIDEIAADNYFDDITDEVKKTLKSSLSNVDDFEKTALINSGYDTALLHQVENAETESNIANIYLNVKDWFMNLYNDNGFAEISKFNFDYSNKKNPDKYNDFDEYMKSEPKYDLKKCEFIMPDIELIAY